VKTLYFAGKGGVGKTTCAAAEAVRRAEEGKRVLVVSTDPAHSLGDALVVPLGAAPRRVKTKRGELYAAELDADRALHRWIVAREPELREIASRGTYLDDEDITTLFRLSLPGVDELVGLVELRRLARSRPWDAVIVDTAPTGHTIRLLETPDALRRIAEVWDDMLAKHRFLAESLGGIYLPDATDEVVDELAADAASLREELRDPARASFAWVLLPEAMPLAETRRGLARLGELGVKVSEVRINRVTPAPERACASCGARTRGEAQIVERAARELAGPVVVVPATDAEPRGVAALRALAASVVPARAVRAARALAPAPPRRRGRAILDAVVPKGVRLVIVGGKGGVGKTTAAAAIALSVAARKGSRKILVLSADPAHSLGDALGVRLGDTPRKIAPNVFARELDADAAFAERRERYREAVDQLFARLLRGPLDAAFDRAVVQDLIDLAPPGLDELFAVLALTAALVGKKRTWDVVVLDTAPTGHTLRLLGLPEGALEWVHALMRILLKYKTALGLGELAQDLVETARELKGLIVLLGDRAQTRFVPVTRAGAVVRLETERLVRKLRALGIPLGPVLLNAATAQEGRLCRRCARRAAIEAREARVLARTTRDMLWAPSVYPPPRGPRALLEWSHAWHASALSSTSTQW
jgi:arsenite-transporting ATPase